MAEYTDYTGRESLWGLGYPLEGEFGSPHDEQLKTTAIGRLIGAMLAALGPGIYSGGLGSIVGGNLQLSPLAAVLPDSLGAVPVGHELATLPASSLGVGVNYVHVQLSETARADGSCGYYVSPSAVPAPDALLVCKVTKSGSAITAVDNTVQSTPALASRIPWAQLIRATGDPQTLSEYLTATLGEGYAGTTPPASVESRLDILEAGGGGGGGGGVPSWGALSEAPGNDTTIRQAAAAIAAEAVAAHVTAAHAAPGDGGATTQVVAEQWDAVAVNGLRLAIQAAHYLPNVAETLQDAVVVVDGHCGAEFVDTEHSTF